MKKKRNTGYMDSGNEPLPPVNRGLQVPQTHSLGKETQLH